MITKTLIFIFTLLFFVSCRSEAETIVNGQSTVETNAKSSQPIETNTNNSQTNVDSPATKLDTETFAKTFYVRGRFNVSKRTMVYTDHLVEFKDNSKEISIYLDKKKKAFLKFETVNPRVRADFLEDNEERYFVVVVGAPGTGTCGDVIFVIVKIDENLNIKISKPNEPLCQGEYYDVKIETIDKPKEFYRQISIGDLRFNLESFNWQKMELENKPNKKIKFVF